MGFLRLVSQDPPKPEDDPCADVAEAIGRKILQSGTTLAGIFRSWDQERSIIEWERNDDKLMNVASSIPIQHHFVKSWQRHPL